MRIFNRSARIALLLSLIAAHPAQAGGWLAAGDALAREDVQLLVSYGLLPKLASTWPMPPGQLALVAAPQLQAAPPAVQGAYYRLQTKLKGGGQVRLSVADQPAVVRGYGDTARQAIDLSVQQSLVGTQGFINLQYGVQSPFGAHGSQPGARGLADGSTASYRLGNWRMWGGLTPVWQGVGEFSSLILSNNARPFPKLGISREQTLPFESPLLRWLGPWRLDYFVGQLNGERRDRDTLFSSLRISLSPLLGLELALTRNTQLCGQHHVCKPAKALLNLNNSDDSTNDVNEQAAIDLRYTTQLGALSVSPYVQHMNDDTGPFKHSYSSHLAGLAIGGLRGADYWQVVAEAADSAATLNAFDFSHRLSGLAYNNGQYVDGMRYRGRTLGFSLDSDSKLYTLAGRYTSAAGARGELALHQATISSASLAAQQPGGVFYNSLSPRPLRFYELAGHLSLPFHGLEVVAGARLRNRAVLSAGQFNVEAGLVIPWGQ